MSAELKELQKIRRDLDILTNLYAKLVRQAFARGRAKQGRHQSHQGIGQDNVGRGTLQGFGGKSFQVKIKKTDPVPIKSLKATINHRQQG